MNLQFNSPAWWRRRARIWLLLGVVIAAVLGVAWSWGASGHLTIDEETCSEPGVCVAVGHTQNSRTSKAVVKNKVHGVWEPARTISLPPSASGRGAGLWRVRCSSTVTCTAIGEFLDRHGAWRPMGVTEVGGRWGRAQEILLPPDAYLRAGK
jgi:hypothetical protein